MDWTSAEYGTPYWLISEIFLLTSILARASFRLKGTNIFLTIRRESQSLARSGLAIGVRCRADIVPYALSGVKAVVREWTLRSCAAYSQSKVVCKRPALFFLWYCEEGLALRRTRMNNLTDQGVFRGLLNRASRVRHRVRTRGQEH